VINRLEAKYILAGNHELLTQLFNERDRLRNMLKWVRRVLPAAADCPEPGVNLVNYTDIEWDQLCEVTKMIDAELGPSALVKLFKEKLK
jgi:hypothetical protein